MTTTSPKTNPVERKNPASKPKRASAAKRSGKSSGSSQKALAQSIGNAAPARKATKRDQLAALLVRDEGATIEQMIAATGWLPHTTRAALTGLRKAGYAIDNDKIDGIRTYRAVAPK